MKKHINKNNQLHIKTETQLLENLAEVSLGTGVSKSELVRFAVQELYLQYLISGRDCIQIITMQKEG